MKFETENENKRDRTSHVPRTIAPGPGAALLTSCVFCGALHPPRHPLELNSVCPRCARVVR